MIEGIELESNKPAQVGQFGRVSRFSNIHLISLIQAYKTLIPSRFPALRRDYV
jgi:hypothetical protein